MNTAIDTAHLKPGFSNPVLDSQATFRAALNAFSFPGRIQTMDRIADPPAPLSAATVAYLLTIADLDTPTWLDTKAGNKSVRDFLLFHCGCPLVGETEAAALAVVTDPAAAPRLGMFAQGDELYPDRSATVIIQVTSFSKGQTVTARGAGVKDSMPLQIDGLPDWFWQDWTTNQACYPLGVDVLLTCGAEAIGLPRSIHLET